MSNRLKKDYKKRRRQKEIYGDGPFFRRILKRIESWNKRITHSAFVKSLNVKKVDAPQDLSTVRSILFIRNDFIGDLVIATAFWRAIKRHYPHIRIGVVGGRRNLAVIEDDPDVDLKFDCTHDSWKHYLPAIREVRRHEWDVVIPLRYHMKTQMALMSKLMAPKAVSSIMLNPGDPISRYERMFSRIRTIDGEHDKTLMAECFRQHLDLAFVHDITESEWHPSIILSSEIQEAVKKRIDSILNQDGTNGYILVHLEAKNAEKEYGLQNNLQLSQALAKKCPHNSILWTASPASLPEAKALLAKQRESRIHTFETANVRELTPVIRFCNLLISPDTSATHIAAAEKRPIIGLFLRYFEWAPYKAKCVILEAPNGGKVRDITLENILAAVDANMSTQ